VRNGRYSSPEAPHRGNSTRHTAERIAAAGVSLTPFSTAISRKGVATIVGTRYGICTHAQVRGVKNACCNSARGKNASV
jgi:hypothetical protein